MGQRDWWWLRDPNGFCIYRVSAEQLNKSRGAEPPSEGWKVFAPNGKFPAPRLTDPRTALYELALRKILKVQTHREIPLTDTKGWLDIGSQTYLDGRFAAFLKGKRRRLTSEPVHYRS